MGRKYNESLNPRNPNMPFVRLGLSFALVLFLIIGGAADCAAAPGDATGLQKPGTQNCVSPVDYGAIPDDGNDDREAFQAAVDRASSLLSSRVVCIPAGVWDLSHRPGVGVADMGSLQIAGVENLTIAGTGQSTRLRMLGSGFRANWRLIDVREGSNNIFIRDMTLDATRREFTAEQTHLLHLNGPVSNVLAERITFDFPRGQPGGDCVRLVGDEGGVRNVLLRHLLGKRCLRSFISVQSNVHKLTMDSVTSQIVSDQAIDFEPSGTEDISDIRIVNSQFARGMDTEGGLTVGISGLGSHTTKGVTITNTKILDGGLALSHVENVDISDVTVRGKRADADHVLKIFGRAVNILIRYTSVIRPFDSLPNPVLRVFHNGGWSPTDILMIGVLLEQNTTAEIAEIESLNSFTMVFSKLVYRGAPGAFRAIFSRGVTAANDHINLNRITVDGPVQGLLRVAQISPQFPIGQVIVTDNKAPDVTSYGVCFEDGTPTSPPSIDGNNFGGVEHCPCECP